MRAQPSMHPPRLQLCLSQASFPSHSPILISRPPWSMIATVSMSMGILRIRPPSPNRAHLFHRRSGSRHPLIFFLRLRLKLEDPSLSKAPNLVLEASHRKPIPRQFKPGSSPTTPVVCFHWKWEARIYTMPKLGLRLHRPTEIV